MMRVEENYKLSQIDSLNMKLAQREEEVAVLEEKIKGLKEKIALMSQDHEAAQKSFQKGTFLIKSLFKNLVNLFEEEVDEEVIEKLDSNSSMEQFMKIFHKCDSYLEKVKVKFEHLEQVKRASKNNFFSSLSQLSLVRRKKLP